MSEDKRRQVEPGQEDQTSVGVHQSQSKSRGEHDKDTSCEYSETFDDTSDTVTPEQFSGTKQPKDQSISDNSNNAEQLGRARQENVDSQYSDTFDVSSIQDKRQESTTDPQPPQNSKEEYSESFEIDSQADGTKSRDNETEGKSPQVIATQGKDTGLAQDSVKKADKLETNTTETHQDSFFDMSLSTDAINEKKVMASPRNADDTLDDIEPLPNHTDDSAHVKNKDNSSDNEKTEEVNPTSGEHGDVPQKDSVPDGDKDISSRDQDGSGPMGEIPGKGDDQESHRTQDNDSGSEEKVQTDQKQTEKNNETAEARETKEEPAIIRNIPLDDATETLAVMEEKVLDLLSRVKQLMGDYQGKAKQQPVSEFVQELPRFQGDFKSMQDAYKRCEDMFVNVNKALKDLRSSGEILNMTFDKKIREEDLSSWFESPERLEEEKSKLKEEQQAITKSLSAKATDARSHAAKATVAISEAEKLASECEAEAVEAASTAARAWHVAEQAQLELKEAERAAAEKRQQEEEARRRAEERAQKRREEEQKKQEQENAQLREIAQRKGTSFAEEKNKAMADKAQREAERRNPRNWPRHIYSIEPGDFDSGVGCVIRSIDGCLQREDVEVRRLDQMSGVLQLLDNEELIGNIVEIVPKDSERKFKFEEPLAIAFPHCLNRSIPGREPVVKTLAPNGKWAEVPSKDAIVEDIKEFRFVEINTRRFGIYAVILRLKRDVLTFTRKGNRVSSTVDARVTFTSPPGLFKSNVNFQCELQSVDQSAVSDLKYRHPGQCDFLLTSSPMLKFSVPTMKFSKPLVFTLPLPPNTSKPKRPSTAISLTTRDKEEKKEGRPSTARAPITQSKEEESEEEIHLLTREEQGTWVKVQDAVLFPSKNKDIVSFEVTVPQDRYILARTTTGVNAVKLEHVLEQLEASLQLRPVHVFLRQLGHSPYEVVLSCCTSGRLDRELKKCAADGFDEGPPPSKAISMREGQVMEVSFRGNIHCVTEDTNLKFIYNTYIRSLLQFQVQETDKFAQKSLQYYRGFAQVSTQFSTPKHATSGEKGKLQPRVSNIEMVLEEKLVAELLINLPKPEPEPPKPLFTAPVKIKADGPDTEDMLQYLAGELGEEWRKLATFLNLKNVRIQAILRQNVNNNDPKKVRHDMLVTWAKRVPRSVNKVEILAHALLAAGRGDLAEELRERDLEFRQMRSEALQGTYLHRAFVKIAQNPLAVKEWKKIAQHLGVSPAELEEIERSHSSPQQRCFHSLRAWQQTCGEDATLSLLSNNLRFCNYRSLARDIDHVY